MDIKKSSNKLTIANHQIDLLNEEKKKLSAELEFANRELTSHNAEKYKRETELITANNKLAFEKKEIEKLAEELIIANKELAKQNTEIEKIANELLLVNKKIVHENEEKEKRAAEVEIANKELVFQNSEKFKRAEELIIANKELAFQNQEKEKRASELQVANKKLAFENQEKEKRAAEVEIANKELVFQNIEKHKRANELLLANDKLVYENQEKEKRAAELEIANKELAFQNSEKHKRAEEFITANKELAYQNSEKEKRAKELLLANKKLVYENEEKEKRAAELEIANKELAFQNLEKHKRAEELVTANKELAYQNSEKEKRAKELLLANKKLAFENQEKEKRAAELEIANKELAYQNAEKKKRAEELLLANEELAYLNSEKMKRADELIIANQELVYQNSEKGKRAEELLLANTELAFLNKKQQVLASIVNSSEDAILSLSLEGIITSWNHGAEKIFGFKADEITGKSILTLIPPSIQIEELDIVKNIREGKRVDPFNSERLRKDGTIFYASITLSSIKNFKGEIVGASKIIRDITAIKQLEEDKKRQAKRFLLATQSANMAIWDWDLENNTIVGDDAMYKLYGIHPNDFDPLYNGWISQIHLEDRQRVENDLQLAIENKKEYDCEFRVVWDDLSIHYVKATGIVERDDDGNAKYMVGANYDITLQKEKEHHLKLLESVITNTTDSVLITEAEPFEEPGNKILYVNDAFTKMTGYPANEILGKSPRILQGPKTDKNELKRLGEAIRKWKTYETQLINYKKNGEEFWINFTLTPVANEKGWYTHWIAIERDITEQKLAELKLSALVKELADYKFALDQSSIVAVTDQRGKIKHINDNFIAISKFSREELIGQDHKIINSGYHDSNFIQNLWVTIANGKIWRGEIKNKAKDGSIYWVETTIVPFLDDKSKPYQYIAIRNDITERNKHQKTIEAQNEKLRDIAWTESHILRAPLARMLGLLNIMEMDSFKSDELPQLMTYFKNSLRELDEVIMEIVQKTQSLDL